MPARFVRLPVRAPGGGADHVLCPLIAQMPQPECDRILAAFGRELRRERIRSRTHCPARPASAARRCGSAWSAGDGDSICHDGKSYSGIELRSPPPPLACGGLVEIMRGNGLASSVAASRAGMRRAPRPRGVAVAPDAVAPVDDFALRIEIGLDLDRHRGTERRMRHLVCARPLHADRPAAGRFRQQHRIERDIVGGDCARSSRRPPYARP